MRHLPHREHEDHGPQGHEDAAVELATQPARRRHRERARDRTWQDDESGLIGAEALQLLQVDGQHEDRGVQAHAQHPAECHARRELGAREDAQVHDRMWRGELVPHERHERRGAHDGIGHDLPRCEPVGALAPLQHGLERAHTQRQQPEADPVHALDLPRIARVPQIGQREQQRRRAERNVDVEDPRPRERVSDVAAERGTERGTNHDADAEDRHRRSIFVWREHFVEHRLGGREQCAAPQTLQDSPQHQLDEGVGVAAEERRDREQRDRAGEIAAAPEIRRQPAGDRQHDDVGDDVARRHPRDLVERRAQVSHHVRNRDVDDAGVDQFHDRRQGHRDRDDVAVRVRIVAHRCARRRRAQRGRGHALPRRRRAGSRGFGGGEGVAGQSDARGSAVMAIPPMPS